MKEEVVKEEVVKEEEVLKEEDQAIPMEIPLQLYNGEWRCNGCCQI